MGSLRQDIEDALIWAIQTKLQKELNPVDGYLGLVGAYNGEIDQTEGPDDFIRRIRGQFPAVLVAATNATLRGESAQRTRFVRILTVEIYVGSDHMRTRESRLRQDVGSLDDPTCDPGIYQIIEDLHAIIAGNDFGLECVDYFQPTREEVLLQEIGFTLWRLQYTVAVDAHVNPRDHDDLNFTQYRLDANLDGDEVDTPPNPFVEAEGDL